MWNPISVNRIRLDPCPVKHPFGLGGVRAFKIEKLHGQKVEPNQNIPKMRYL